MIHAPRKLSIECREVLLHSSVCCNRIQTACSAKRRPPKRRGEGPRDRGTRRSVAVNLVNPMPCNFCHPPILLEMDGKDHAKLEVYQIIGFALPHYSGQ